MAERIELNSENEFVEWLAETPDAGRFRYGRLLLPETLVLSDQDRIQVSEDRREAPEVFVAVSLPSASEGVRWWKSLWESLTSDCWIGSCYGQAVVCMAVGGVWRPSDTLFAEMHAADFRMVLEKDLKQWVDSHMLNEMAYEVRLVGFSVRVVAPRALVERTKPKGRRRK